MKTQKISTLELIEEQLLSPDEQFLLGFLKGHNRFTAEKWQKEQEEQENLFKLTYE